MPLPPFLARHYTTRLYLDFLPLTAGSKKEVFISPHGCSLLPCVGEGATPFPGLLHFTLDPNLIVLRAKQDSIK